MTVKEWTTEQPTLHFQTRAGVLEQQWEVRSYSRGPGGGHYELERTSLLSVELVWRPVPAV